MTKNLTDDSVYRSIVTVTSEAMEGELVCGMEVELAEGTFSGGTDYAPIMRPRSGSWSPSSASDSNLAESRRFSNFGKKMNVYSGPFLPDSCEVNDLVDGRCSPVYDLKRKPSVAKHTVPSQLTNPTLSISSMTDQSDVLSCPSDEVSSMGFVKHATMKGRAAIGSQCSSEPSILAELFSFTSSEASENSVLSMISSPETEDSDQATCGALVVPTQRIVFGPELPPPAEATMPSIINVVEPQPDRLFLDLLERSYHNLRRVTLTRSEFLLALSSSSIPLVPNHRREMKPFLALRDFGPNGFMLAPIPNVSNTPLVPLLFHTNNGSSEITLCDFGSHHPCDSILACFHLATEALRLKSQFKAWSTALASYEPPQIRDTPYSSETGALVKHDEGCPEVAPSASVDDDSTVLFEDEELRTMMLETRGGRDIAQLSSCYSEDTMATYETDDGLHHELKALDSIEDDLRKQMQDLDLFVQGVYVKEVRMKSQSSDRLAGTEKEEGRHRRRRVRFSRQNTEYVFGTPSWEDENDEEEGIGEMILTTCEDLYYGLEEMTEDIGYACLNISKEFLPRPTETTATKAGRPPRRSIFFCS